MRTQINQIFINRLNKKTKTMNFLREMVAGKKKRYKEQGFNLDLTYVTPRIIAMSLPGEGLTGFYRNPIDQVAQFLYQKHGPNYIVFNLSGQKYNEKKFNQVISQYQWEDHHSPALDVIFQLCNQMHTLLKSCEEFVVVIHCLAGKGRTGTIICCYLLFCGLFQTVEDAMYYYGRKRFKVDGLGVNQPCQIRYVYYFHRLLTGEKVYPSLVCVKEIQFLGRPKFNMDGGCKPYVEIINVRTLEELYSQKKKNKEILKFSEGNSHTIKIEAIEPLYGDILINIRNIAMLSEGKMMRFSFNTAFLDNDKQQDQIKLGLNDLDPSQVATDQRFPKDFQLIISLDQLCKCTNQTNFDKKCEECMSCMGKEHQYWGIIYDILDRYEKYEKPTLDKSDILIFRTKEQDDRKAIFQLKQHYSGEIQLMKNNLEELEIRAKAPTFTFQLEEEQNDKLKLKKLQSYQEESKYN